MASGGGYWVWCGVVGNCTGFALAICQVLVIPRNITDGYSLVAKILGERRDSERHDSERLRLSPFLR